MQLIDTHCHLTHGRFQEDADQVVRDAQAAGIVQMMTISTGLADAAEGVELCARWPGVVHRACGLDPFTCFERHHVFREDLAQLREHLQEHACAALGEVGLEYFHTVLPAQQQHECLQAQLQLAQDLTLPVVIHVRDAHADMQAILAQHPQVVGVIHSFDGTADDARAYLDLGWYISFNGMSTFKKKGYLRDAVAMVPEERLLFETDSPFLSPEPLRGRRCQPSYVVHVVEAAARQRGVSAEHLAQVSTANACRLFAFPHV
ncbi:MAG: TatD family deoxyribonuclease [Planctomycetota bacterium]|nr:MAG: TatD family deoxyribonuclease [Planctomycetota bacterium]